VDQCRSANAPIQPTERLGALPVRDYVPEGGMKPLTIVVSFDVGEQVVPGDIAGWIASLVHEFTFQSAKQL
jgi:hypothetical protein